MPTQIESLTRAPYAFLCLRLLAVGASVATPHLVESSDNGYALRLVDPGVMDIALWARNLGLTIYESATTKARAS